MLREKNKNNLYIKDYITLRPFFISSITEAELFHGAYKSSKTDENTRKIERFLKSANIVVFPVTSPITNIYGQIAASLEKKGIIIDYFDILIASTALFYKIPILTKDKHFLRLADFGLKVELINNA